MSTPQPQPTTRRKLLFALAALILPALLLFTWFGALAAGEDAYTQAGLGVKDNAALLQATQSITQPLDVQATLTPTAEIPASPKPQAVSSSTILSVNKTHTPTSFKIGSGNTYAIYISNNGVYSQSGLIAVEDNLPLGMTWTPVNMGRWNCVNNSTPTQVNCFYTQNNPVSFDPIQFQVVVAEDIPDTSVTNHVTLNAPESDPASTLMDDDDVVIDSVDLSISKVASPTSIVTGTIDYRITITNTGPSTATSVIVNENIPTELAFESAVPAGQFTTTTTAGVWTVDDMPPNTTRTLVLTFRTRSSASGKVIANTATVRQQSKNNDYRNSNNSASASVIVGGPKITKMVSPSTVTVGQPFTITVVVKNPTNSEIKDVSIKDEMNDYIIPLKTPSGNFNVINNTYTTNMGNLAANAQVERSFTVMGSSSISSTYAFTNAATVTWGPPGGRISLNSNQVDITISPGGSLVVGKSDGVTQVYPGDVVTYTVSVTNTGNLPVHTIKITDTLGVNLSAINLVVPSTLGTGSCPTPSQCVVSLTSPLSAGTKVSFKIAAKVYNQTPTGGASYVYNNVTATGIDESSRPTASIYQDANQVIAVPIFNMEIQKSVAPAQARVDENLTFRINVSNQGSEAVTAARVVDDFNDVLDIVSVDPSRGTATTNTTTRAVTWDIGTLNPGETVRIAIVTKVNATATSVEVYRNTARLTWAGAAQGIHSNEVRYRVLPKATLPGTGIQPWGAGAAAATLPALTPGQLTADLVVAAGFGLALLGLLALAYSIFLRARHPLHAGPYTRLALALIVTGLFAGMLGVGLLTVSAPSPELALLEGDKPPFATDATLPQANHQEATLTPDLSIYLPTPTPLTLPDYPVPAPTAMAASGPNGIEPDASDINRLVIERMGLDTIVKYVPYDGQTWMIGGLKQEIAWMGNTSWPGLGGNTGLAGHVDFANGDPGPFWNLKDLQAGDKVILYTQKNVYTYIVREHKVVNDYELSVIDPTDDAQITLITCTGWDAELHAYLQRLVVHADLSEVKPLGQ